MDGVKNPAANAAFLLNPKAFKKHKGRDYVIEVIEVNLGSYILACPPPSSLST